MTSISWKLWFGSHRSMLCNAISSIQLQGNSLTMNSELHVFCDYLTRSRTCYYNYRVTLQFNRSSGWGLVALNTINSMIGKCLVHTWRWWRGSNEEHCISVHWWSNSTTVIWITSYDCYKFQCDIYNTLSLVATQLESRNPTLLSSLHSSFS